ncbi:hypothetical protein [Amycolatopsis panacis]|uniref:hypothetical protein n=1 Tax=Amycolatopsis panacis TaxID=2340917 RepID=UPI001314E12C|nr:hypothetical protein [Amycolatopsis panacis]
MSGGTFRESRTEFTVRGLTGTELATWFRELFAVGLDDASTPTRSTGCPYAAV